MSRGVQLWPLPATERLPIEKSALRLARLLEITAASKTRVVLEKATTQAPPATFQAAMETISRKQILNELSELDTIACLRRGSVSILEAVAVRLPEVFYGEILARLDMKSTLNLVQVSKWCGDAIWSVEGVLSMAKSEAAVRQFAEHGCDIESMFAGLIFKHGNMPALRALKEAGVVDFKNDFKNELDCMTPLIIATMNAHLPVMRALLEAGVDVNERKTIDSSSRLLVSALHIALWDTSTTTPFCGKRELLVQVVKELIKAGADENQAMQDETTGQFKATPLALAVMYGQKVYVAMLIEAGADVNKRLQQDLKLLKIARGMNPEHKHYKGIEKLLLEAGAVE
jgi:hypothetical protein